MATFEELYNRVLWLVQDDLGDSEIIYELLNQGLLEIAGGMKSFLGDAIIPPLPDLFKIDNVTTVVGQAFTDMPSDFQRELLFASVDGNEVDISHTFIEFTEIDPSLHKVGRIIEVIEHGKKLYYLNIPETSKVVTVHYYRKPVKMVNYDSVPDGLPEHFHYKLLVNYAVWKAYEFIEDGLEGEAVNTAKYKGFFMEALAELELFIPLNTRNYFAR